LQQQENQMDFGFTPRQQELWERTVSFAREQIPSDDLVERDRAGAFSDEAWQACARQGLLGLGMPEAYGGAGYDTVTAVHALEALGYGCLDNGLTLAINGQTWSIQTPILKFGSAAQREALLPGLISGRIKGAHAITEPEAGSDVFSLTTAARKVEGGYRISGQKISVGMAPAADIFVLFATLNPALGRWGVTAFVVDARAPGVTTSVRQDKIGLRTEPHGTIDLDDVFVPADGRLGNEGAGASIFNASMQYERSFIFTSHVGSIARQLDQTIAFANARRQGGQPIGRYQAVAHRVADMRVRLETARLFLYRAAWLIDQGQDAALHSAMTKLTVSELLLQNSLDAVRVHGGRGYLGEHAVERDLRDTLGGVLYAGTSDIQRNLIAGLLGL
jgi:alkylation response protein AidB-like acyl-CoA dehydrogenase